MQIFLLVFMVALALTMWSRGRFQKIYDQELRYTISSGVTGAQLAERILEKRGIEGVRVAPGYGVLMDFYNPGKRLITLAPQHFNGSTFSALGMAAQQAGKAIQHFEGHRPLLWRSSVIQWTVFLSIPLLLIALATLLLGMTKTIFPMILLIWSLIAFWNLATVPTELDAGERAKRQLEKIRAFKNLDERVGVERVMGASSTAYIDGLSVIASWAARMVVPFWKKHTEAED